MGAVEFREPKDDERESVMVVYADEASIEVLGRMVRWTFYERRHIAGHTDRVPVLEVIRPKETLICTCVALQEAGLRH